MFQSTHPHGVRLFDLSKSTKKAVVSIHAPTRGATDGCSMLLPTFEFQSTHPHGVRLQYATPSKSPPCFNPRTHTGCDQALTGQINGLTVSIHAPTRGATVIRVYTFGCSGVSIHAPTRGATLSDNGPFQEMVCFNPRTHTGCDHDRMGKHRSLPVSIHAPTRGATVCKL